MSDSESDIEIRSALPKMKIQKQQNPRSPTEDIKTKKITTKVMIIDALKELNTRKGVSLYAIKKHLMEKYEVNTNKVNYLIKKTIKAGVEDGTFVQMKGIGAAGSFKLANNKEKPKIKKKPAKPKEIKEKKKEKPTTSPQKTTKKVEKKIVTKKTDDKKVKEAKKPKKMEIKKTVKADEKEKKKKKETKVKTAPEKEDKQVPEEKEKKKKKVKIAKGMATPSKKRSAMMKRKSIGSIIKPPKMKPKKA